MVEQWISLADIPAHGREFSFDDPEMWASLWMASHCEVTPIEPLRTTLTILPQAGGYFIQGLLVGALTAACHRCLEPAHVDLHQPFDTFESPEDTDDDGEPCHLRHTDSGWELNISALLWEEFLLAMPEKILCADTCLGLCPHCGKNRNLETCVCGETEASSSLGQALQTIKVKLH